MRRIVVRALIAALAVLMVSLPLAGCLGTRGETGKPVREGAGAAGFPLTIVDDAGRTVRLDRAPQRILSLAPSNTEILYAIGLGDKIVGADSFSDFPEAAKGLEKVGGVLDPNYEKMVALKPDLALIISGADKIVAKLDELKIPVFVVAPRTVEEAIDSIVTVGTVAGARSEAEKVAAGLRARLNAVRERTAAVPADRRPRVFYEVWNDPLMTAGPGTVINDLIVLAGGRNVAGDTGQEYPQYSLEVLLEKNPEVIITTFPDSYEQLRQGKRAGWENVAAIKGGRVALLDQNIVSRPGPRLVDALEQFEKVLRP